MNLSVETASMILPASASLALFIFVFVNLYKKIRKKFPVKVNCWFCNEWSKVEYDNGNCFVCPKCEQYNGFTQDGDYNRVIPAQFDEFMNKRASRKTKEDVVERNNGLCTACNNNQRLKIHQLAVFSPIDVANFHDEVDQYQRQLERAYPLCNNCESVLKYTLTSQKSLLLKFNLSNSKNGQSFLNNSYELKTARKLFLKNLIKFFIATLSFIEISQTANQFINGHNPLSLPEFTFLTEIFHYYINLIPIFQNFYFIIFESFQKFFSVSLLGLFLETSLIFLKNGSGKLIIIGPLLWTFNLIDFKNEFYQLAKIFTSITLILLKIERKSNEKIEFTIDEKDTSTPEKENLFQLKEKPSLNFNDGLKFNQSFNESLTPMVFENPLQTTRIFRNDTIDKESVFNESLTPVFGEKPIFENPLQPSRIPFRNDTFDKESIFNGSLNLNGPDLDLSINDRLSELHLGTYHIRNEMPKTFRVIKVKPILSPPKLGNLTQSSWLAGGYWKSDEFSNLSRSSSQSSGFGSQTSTQNLNGSLPPSRSTSICGEFDRVSVFSEPVSRTDKNYFVPINSQKLNSKVGAGLWEPFGLPSVSSGVSSVRSAVPAHKLYEKSNGYVRGSLLQKWREQNAHLHF